MAGLGELEQQVESCIEALKEGSLGEEDLRRIGEVAANGADKRQSILYLQAQCSSLQGKVIGMSLFVDGCFHDPPSAEEWPYCNVAEALADGWRIIKFPEMALLLDESRTYGYGCEFILEKWR